MVFNDLHAVFLQLLYANLCDDKLDHKGKSRSVHADSAAVEEGLDTAGEDDPQNGEQRFQREAEGADTECVGGVDLRGVQNDERREETKPHGAFVAENAGNDETQETDNERDGEACDQNVVLPLGLLVKFRMGLGVDEILYMYRYHQREHDAADDAAEDEDQPPNIFKRIEQIFL